MTKRPTPPTLWSWVMATLVIALPLTGVLCWLMSLFFPTYLPLFLAGWGGFLLLVIVVYLPLRRRSMAFSLDQEHIITTSGVVFTTTRRMRLDAVRQVTLWQGPLERRFGTAFLLISATGGHLLIEGIDRAVAEEWCKKLQPR